MNTNNTTDTKSLFTLAKTVPMRAYLEYHYGERLDFKGKSNAFYCPFHSHDHKTPSASIKSSGGEEFFHCFNCGTAGDLAKFVEKIERKTNVEAAKTILRNENIYFVDDSVEKSLSDEEIKRLDIEEKARIAAYEKAKKERLEQEQKETKEVQEKLSIKAPIYLKDFQHYFENNTDAIKSMFPNISANFGDWYETYLGYDKSHESIVFVISEYQKDAYTYHNVKHREKFAWDDTIRALSHKRQKGKWIGHYQAKSAPFPIDYHKEHNDTRVFIVEGEKDAFNLLCLDVNVLTLGGVSNLWDEHLHLLKDKEVYVWFDNDTAGYVNAVKKAKTFEKVASIVYLIPMFMLNSGMQKGYDISDYIIEHKISDKEELFHRIAYSASTLTNALIDEVSEFTGVDLKDEKKSYDHKDIRDIKAMWLHKNKSGDLIYIKPVKGELDDGKDVDLLVDHIKNLKGSTHYDNFVKVMKGLLFNDKDQRSIEEVGLLMDKFATVKKQLLTNYHQTHIVDMFTEFMRMAKNSGHPFAEYAGNLCIWTGIYWQTLEDPKIVKKFIHQQWMFHAKVDYKKQTEQNVELIYDNVISKALHIDEIKKYQQKRVLNLLNGTLFVSKKAKFTFIEDHSQSNGCTNLLHFEYNDKARAPKWEKFLNRNLPDREDQLTLMEFIGYCIMPSHEYEAFLYLYGKTGANGKSVVLEIVRSFFGEENVASLQLQSFHGHELHALSNKILNIGSEIDSKGLDKGQIETMKNLVSAKDTLTINPKNKDPYTLLPAHKPKMAFAANNKITHGVDDAFFRRMLFLNFKAEIKDDEKIRDLTDRFKDEMPGILNMALNAAQDLVKRGKFTKSQGMQDELSAYKRDVNPMLAYVEECIVIDPEVMVEKKPFYDHYKEWCDVKGYKAKASNRFYATLKDELKADIDTQGVQITKSEIFNGDKPRFIKGIKVISNDIISFKHSDMKYDTKGLNRWISDCLVVVEDDYHAQA